MKNNIILGLLFLFPLVSIFSQNYILDEEGFIEMPSFTKTNWPDTLGQNILYWENDLIKLDYLKNEKTIRREYYASGNVKYEVEVLQVFLKDTFEIMDMSTYSSIITVETGIKDVFNGAFIAYFDSPDKRIKSKGQFLNNIQIGEWTYNDKLSYLVVNYNEQGDREGLCYEYYSNKDALKPMLRCEGEYGYVNVVETIYSFDVDKYVEMKSERVGRIGKWRFYSKSGKLIRKEKYKN